MKKFAILLLVSAFLGSAAMAAVQELRCKMTLEYKSTDKESVNWIVKKEIEEYSSTLAYSESSRSIKVEASQTDRKVHDVSIQYGNQWVQNGDGNTVSLLIFDGIGFAETNEVIRVSADCDVQEK